MNIICIGGRRVQPRPRHLRRLSKVAFLELQPTRTN